MKAAIFLLLAVCCQAQQQYAMTEIEWEWKTADKTVFVKFFAPWCGHCQAMKPAWDELMAEYKDHQSILVTEVDCEGAGASLCGDLEVKGYPTIKYGDPNELETYKGQRTYDALSEFASTLKPPCDPNNLDACRERDQQRVEEYMKMSDLELSDLVESIQEPVRAARKKYQDEAAKLKKKFQELEDEVEEVRDRFRDRTAKLPLMKRVLMDKVKKSIEPELQRQRLERQRLAREEADAEANAEATDEVKGVVDDEL